MTNKKIALFGGSFNPIHNHHLKMANSVLEKKVAKEVWMIPTKNHPFNKSLAPAQDRINMINLAVNNPNIKVNTTEIESNETNYTIRTIKKLKSQYPQDHEFYWIVGADVLHNMHLEWYGIEELLEETPFIIFNRKGYSMQKVPDMKVKQIIEIATDDESSSHARYLASQNKSLKDIVPLSVEEYIQQKGLYRK